MGDHNNEDHGFMDHLKINLSRLLYEFFGTCMFTLVFFSTSVNSGGLLLALWILTVFCWKISGSHFNPAISLTVYSSEGFLPEHRSAFLLMMLAQVLGAFMGILIFYLGFQ